MKQIMTKCSGIIFALVWFLLISGCKKEHFTPLGVMKQVPRIEWLSGNPDVFRDSSVTISLRYDVRSMQKGEYPIFLIFTLKNISDTVKYIEQPKEDKRMDNPLFYITTENGEHLFEINDVDKVYGGGFPPNSYFIKLEPHDSISYKVKIDAKYNFARGIRYHINATYCSRYALIRDSTKEKASWCNIIHSNVLNYDY
jgi:hypothetical protein